MFSGYALCAGMEATEKLGSYGLTANLMVYLVKVFHMDQIEASNVINIWDSASNFLPIIGAIIADVFLGKFLVISLASFISLLVCCFCFHTLSYSAREFVCQKC